MKKIASIFSLVVLLVVPFLHVGTVNAATSVAITSPTSGASVSGSSFTVSGTATAHRNISVKVNGAVVGTTTSDDSGNWSLNVTGQHAGAKTVEAVAGYQQLYVNSLSVGSLSNSVMTKINPVNNQVESSFSLFSNSSAPLFWVPNGNFTKAYGAAGPLGSPYVYVVDLANDSVSSFTMAGTSPNPGTPAYNSDSTKVYIPDGDTNNDIVRVYNTATNAEIGSGVAVGDRAGFAAHRPGTNEVWVTNQGDNTISIIDTASDTVIDTYAAPSGTTCLYFNPSGSKAYAVQCAGTSITEMDGATGAIGSSVSVSSGAIGYAPGMNSDGTKLYLPNINSNQLDVLDTASMTISTITTVGTGPLGVVLSPDDTKAYVSIANASGGFTGNTISVVDLTSGSLTNTINVTAAPSVGWFAPLESASTSVSFNLTSASLADTG